MPILSKSDRILIAIATMAITVGVFCRVEGLTSRSLWLDEVLTARRVSYPTVMEVVTHLKNLPFPPLYYCVLWLWTRPLGVSMASMRGLPVILGILTLPATYLIWKGLVGRRAALWGVILLSTCAFPIWYSQDAKMYAAVWLLATVVGGSFLRALADEPRRRSWLRIYALSNGALLLISYVGVVPMLVQGLYAAVLVVRRRARGRVVFQAAAAALLSSVPLMLWVPLSHLPRPTMAYIEWIPPTSGSQLYAELSSHFSTYLIGVDSGSSGASDTPLAWIVNGGGSGLKGLIGVVVVLYWVRLIRDTGTTPPPDRSATPETTSPSNQLTEADVGVYLTIWAILPVLGAFLFSIVVFPLSGVPRYMSASAPGLFLLVASALATLKPRSLALAVGLALVTFNLTLVAFGKTHTTLVPWRDLIRIAAHVAAASPGSGGDPTRPPGEVSMVYHNRLHPNDFEWNCIVYERNRRAADEPLPVSLRVEPFAKAVRRGESFLIIEHDTGGDSADTTRRAIERAIVDAGGTVPFSLREIETVRVFQGRHTVVLPDPLVNQSAAVWLAMPAGP